MRASLCQRNERIRLMVGTVLRVTGKRIGQSWWRPSTGPRSDDRAKCPCSIYEQLERIECELREEQECRPIQKRQLPTMRLQDIAKRAIRQSLPLAWRLFEQAQP